MLADIDQVAVNSSFAADIVVAAGLAADTTAVDTGVVAGIV